MNITTTTKNKSFIRVSEQLQDLGVKNSKFMLQLNNPKLENIDPWAYNLSPDNTKDILEECENNFWYFLREVLKWADNDNSLQRTKLDIGLLATHYLALNSIDVWRSAVKQTTCTTSTQSFLLYNIMFREKINAGAFVQYPARYKATINRMNNWLPSWLSLGAMRKLETNFTFNVNDYYSLHKFTENEDLSKYSPSNIMIYEDAEHIPSLEKLLDFQNPLYVDNKNNSDSDSDIFTRIFISTKTDKSSKNVPFLEKFQSEFFKWNNSYYDLDIPELKEKIVESSNGVVLVEYNYKELGYSDEWFEEMSSGLKYNKDFIKRELLCER